MKFWEAASMATALVLSTTVNASTVFNIAGINDLEWLELTATANISRAEVEAQLTSDGIFNGWRYASRAEVETLYDSLWGGATEGWSADNYNGARQFLDAFGVPSSGYTRPGLLGQSGWNTNFGSKNECGNTPNLEYCVGSIAITDIEHGAASNTGWFTDSFGLSTGIDQINESTTTNNNWISDHGGSHLVRVSAVPIPAAIWLFGSGLIGLVGFAKRK